MTIRATTPGPGIVQLALADPQRRNPLSLATLAALRSGLDEAIQHGARVVVLTADGPVFSAGADLDDLTGTAADEHYDDTVAALTTAITAAPIPVIAAIDGACIGAAVDLALSCDLVVVGCTAYLEIPAARLGILYNPAAIARLHRRVPASALRALLLGERLDAPACIHAGLALSAVEGAAAGRTSSGEGAERPKPVHLQPA